MHACINACMRVSLHIAQQDAWRRMTTRRMASHDNDTRCMATHEDVHGDILVMMTRTREEGQPVVVGSAKWARREEIGVTHPRGDVIPLGLREWRHTNDSTSLVASDPGGEQGRGDASRRGTPP